MMIREIVGLTSDGWTGILWGGPQGGCSRSLTILNIAVILQSFGLDGFCQMQ